MKVVAIVQARMTSTRLPNKVLKPLAGKPVLEHIVNRLNHCRTLSAVLIATSLDTSDDAIEAWCKTSSVNCYRGSLNDVLDRYYEAATQYNADAVVRITGDCPVIDPEIVDEVVNAYLAGDWDCFSLAGEFPDGLDCQVFRYEALAKAWREARLPSEREHVGPYIEKNYSELFKIGTLVKFQNLSHHRWTLDEPKDYIFLSEIFNRLYMEGHPFLTTDILDLLQMEPSLSKINSNILRNEGYLKSIQSEKS